MINSVVLLGPTASGKTSLAVKLAQHFNSHIISCDSRQVYKGLDIGSGKDLSEYTVPYHLIDVTDLSVEYSLYDYVRDFYTVFNQLVQKNITPFIVGGTGLYLDAIIRNYDLIEVPINQNLRAKLENQTLTDLQKYLINLKKMAGTDLHNKTDTEHKKRLIRAIEIEEFKKNQGNEQVRQIQCSRKKLQSLVLGIKIPRTLLRQKIKNRIISRIKNGMIEEVESLHKSAPGLPHGASWERLERLGLEYRFISEYLQGKYASKDAFIEALYIAIGQFAKRQETWFRGMQKKGINIHYFPEEYADNLILPDDSTTMVLQQAIDYISSFFDLSIT